MPEPPPRDVQAALVELSQRQEALTVALRPWAAWQIVLVCQLIAHEGDRGPMVRTAAEEVGRAVQAAIAAAVPAAEPFLEAGWPPPSGGKLALQKE